MTDRRSHLDTRAIGLLAVCCLIWGIQQVIVKATLPMMPPMMQAALRSAVAALLVWGWARQRGIALGERDGSLWPGLVSGLLFAGEFVCVYLGLGYTTASRLVVLVYLSPFVVAAGMPFISRHERLSPGQVTGLVLGFAAVVLAFADRSPAAAGAGQRWIGDLLAVGAAVLWGATVLVMRGTRLAVISPEKSLLYQLGVSAVVLAAASGLAGETLPAQWPLALFGSLFFQCVIVAFASYLGWFWLVRHYPAVRLASFSFLAPLLGLVCGWALLDEPLSISLVMALGGVAFGIWLVNRAPAAPSTRAD